MTGWQRSLAPPNLIAQKMFAEGQLFHLEIIDLSAEGSTASETLKAYNAK